jgi:hypothetical protein
MKRIIVIFVLMCATVSMWAQQPDCNQFGNCNAAKSRADQGNKEAMYCYAMNCVQSMEEGLLYLNKSAEKNYAPAQWYLGTLYETGGNGLLTPDPSRAVDLYRKSANQGYAPAQFFLGNGYMSGFGGFPQSIEDAVKWWTKSAEQDYYDAQTTLGGYYKSIDNKSSALYWFKKALAIVKKNRTNIPQEMKETFDQNMAQLEDEIRALKSDGVSSYQESAVVIEKPKATYVRTDVSEKTFDSKGGTQDIHVESDGKLYLVSGASDWCSVEYKGSFFTLTCKENYGASRDIVLTVTVDSKTALIIIKQTEPVATYIRSNPNSIPFRALGGKTEISILTDGYQWAYSDIPAWLTASKSGKTLTLTAQSNFGKARNEDIKISSGNYSETISVSQPAQATYIKADKSNISFKTGGNSETVKIDTDGEEWTYTNIPSWITAKKDGNYLTLHSDENTGQYGGKRESTIAILSDSKAANISVTQSAPFNAPKGDPRLIGVSVGYVQKQWNWKENGETHKIGAFDKENSSLNGIQAGIRIEPLFKYGLGLSTGLFYEYYFSKSDKYRTTYSDSPEEYDYHLNFTEHSLYVPLHLEYRLNLSKKLQLFVEVGPSIDFGLSGKLTATAVGDKEPYFTETGIYRNSEIGFPQKRFNASLDFGAGIRVGGGLQLNVGMSRGLLNISSNPEINIKQNKRLTASLSWMLNNESLDDFMDKDKDGKYQEHGMTVGFISKQWDWKTENYVSKSGLWEDSKSVPGFRLGYIYQPQFAYGFGLRTGLNFDAYISVSDDMNDDNGNSYYWLFSEMAVNIPLHAEYRLHFSKNVSLFFETGASIECGLFAEMEAHGSNIEKYKESGLYGKADWGYPSNRFNVYWDFAGGLRFKKFQISAGASRGLTPVTLDDGWKATQNRNLSLELSYFF